MQQEIVDPAIAGHGGRLVKTIGDELLLEFPSVVNAMRCAVEVQTAMAGRTADLAEDRRIAFRIGLNIGDIIVDGDDIFGDGVNVAARLQKIAVPGGLESSTGPCLPLSTAVNIATTDWRDLGREPPGG